MNAPFFYTMQQCDTVTMENATMPYIKSLYSCLNSIEGNGYTDSFQPTVKGLQSKKNNRIYNAKDIRIINFFRFEGNAKPEDNVVLYMIETTDGEKGTLIYSKGTYHEHLFKNLFMLGHELAQ